MRLTALAATAAAVLIMATSHSALAASPKPGQLGASCGSRGLAPCKGTLYCDFPVASQCGATDQPGTCQRRSRVCNKAGLRVCGCNGKTYGNDCMRGAAGVGKRSDGACKPN